MCIRLAPRGSRSNSKDPRTPANLTRRSRNNWVDNVCPFDTKIIFFPRKDGVRVKSVPERYCMRPATINLSIVFEIHKIVFQWKGILGYVYKCDENTPCFQKKR